MRLLQHENPIHRDGGDERDKGHKTETLGRYPKKPLAFAFIYPLHPVYPRLSLFNALLFFAYLRLCVSG